MHATRWLGSIAFLFFFSGFTGLVFEVLWTRQLSSVVGATSVAMTCVFSVFIVCLSLGALLASRLRLDDRQALALYGGMEIAIGVLGCGVTLVMLHCDVWLARWIPLTSTLRDVLVQLFATLLLIGLPTALMGATLPVLISGVQRVALPSAHVALLYAANVAGGALGALFCGFFLLWQLGVTGTALLALAVNVCIGAAALAISRALGRVPARAPESGRPPETHAQGGRIRFLLYPTLAFLTGLFALSYELLWGRMAKLYLGDRTMATATLLFIYLACMALGSLVVGLVQRRRPASSFATGLGTFGAMLAVAAGAHLVAVRALHFVIGSPALAPALSHSAIPRVVVTLALLLMPVTLLGMAFPFLLQTANRIDERPALTVGVLYFVNALGGALGALFGGFLAPRSIGTLRGFLVTSLAMGVVALACNAASGGSRSRRLVRAGVFAALLASASVWMPRQLIFHDPNEQLIAWNEDEYGVQTVTRNQAGHLNVKNNRLFLVYTLGLPATSFTQETIAYEACLLSERCEDVLNIGTGYGITAGAFTTFETVKTIVTIELLPFLCEIQPLFSRYNFQYYLDPRVTRRCTDGRRALAASDQHFDVITVNVLDPYLPGSSGLFTTDFWALAKRRLRPGGVYAQLVWGPDAERLLQGLASVFPRIVLFPTAWKDSFNVVAFTDEREPALHLERLSPEVQRQLSQLSVGDAQRFFSYAFERSARLEAKREGEPSLVLHTDDMPILEFRWARGDRRSHFDRLYRTTSLFDSLQVHP